MPRHARAAPGGYVYHALNRAVARLPLFQKAGDYEAFERVLDAALKKHPTRLLAYWPRKAKKRGQRKFWLPCPARPYILR